MSEPKVGIVLDNDFAQAVESWKNQPDALDAILAGVEEHKQAKRNHTRLDVGNQTIRVQNVREF